MSSVLTVHNLVNAASALACSAFNLLEEIDTFHTHRLIAILLADVFQSAGEICLLLYYTVSDVDLWFKGRCTRFSNIF